MEISKNSIAVFVVILLVALACGGQSEVVVVQPDKDSSVVDTIDESVPPAGTARSNPAPMGSAIIAFDMVFTVIDYERPANKTIERANMFNTKPQGDREYILIEMEIACEKTFDEKCVIRGSSFEIVGDGGVIYNRRYASGVKGGLITNEEFFGGTTITGKIPFIIERSETNLILIYDQFLKSPIYFEIP